MVHISEGVLLGILSCFGSNFSMSAKIKNVGGSRIKLTDKQSPQIPRNADLWDGQENKKQTQQECNDIGKKNNAGLAQTIDDTG